MIKREMEDFIITKQSINYNNYNENGVYNFTCNLKIDKDINHAVNRNYKIFNIKNENYRIERLSNLPVQFEIFKIAGREYFIEIELNSKKTEKYVQIYNYEYQIKWLNYLNQIRGNYLIKSPKGISKGIVRDASKIEIYEIDSLAKITEILFKKCYEFHSLECFDDGKYNANRMLNLSCDIHYWQQKVQRDFIEIRNSLIYEMKNLFLSKDAYSFFIIKDFIIKILSETINDSAKQGFQWGYSPFKKAIFELSGIIEKNHPDKKIELKDKLKKPLSNDVSTKKNILQSIWLPQSKISVENFLKLGLEKRIWNEQNQIITKRGSLYGSGKTLLGSLSIALRGYAISESMDYKEVGKVFCKAFKENINEKTKEPYKLFSSGNYKIISVFKREFNIKL